MNHKTIVFLILTAFVCYSVAYAVEVEIPDPNLETALREALNKPTGAITNSDLASLTSFAATYRNISDLTGLQYCINLTWLDLSNNQINNLSPLSELENLIFLALWHNQVDGVASLSKLISLRELYLGGDANRAGNLTNLEHLSLWRNQVTDISPLNGLTNLKELYLGGGGNHVGDDINLLSGLTNLQRLDLGETQVSNISPLSSLTKLEYLSLWRNQVTDISPLVELINLRELYFGGGGNHVGDDINLLSGLTNLQRLDLGDTAVSNISALSGLTKLEYLSLWNNQVTDITPLTRLTNLKELYLGGIGNMLIVRAFDVCTSEPIARVDLTLNNISAKTNSSGQFQISLPPGRYNVSASVKGYIIEHEQVEIKPKQVTELSLPASPFVNMWPGDTDNDGRVSILDIFQVIKFWHSKGNMRATQGIKWQGEIALVTDWKPTKALYADTNGDGFVDENDIVAVAINWQKGRDGNTQPNTTDYTIIHIPKRHLPIYKSIKVALDANSECEGAIALKQIFKTIIDYISPQNSILLQNYPNPFNPSDSKTWIPFRIGGKNSVSIRIQNPYHNPFNPEVWMPFSVINEDNITISIHDSVGNPVRKLNLGIREPGPYLDKTKAAYWDGTNDNGEKVASGIYFYTIRTGHFKTTRKMLLLK